MSALVDLLAAHGLRVALGATAALGVGGILVSCARRPAVRQRAGELAVVSALVWLALSPLPRLPREAPPADEVHRPARAVADEAREQQASAAPPVASAAAVPDEAARSDDRSMPPAPPASALPGAVEPAASAGSDGRALERRPATLPAIAWPRVLATLYLAGALAGAAWIGLGAARLRGILRRAVAPSAELAAHFARIAAESGAPRARLVVTRACAAPFCAGTGRGIVVIPEALVAASGAAGLDALLRHELVHAARRDGRSHLLFALAVPLFWCHPLFWFVRARSRLAAELIADDGAAAGARADYARRLIDLAVALPPSRFRPLAAAGVLKRTSELQRRIAMLLARSRPLDARCPVFARALLGASALLVPCLVTLLLGAPPAAAQEDPRSAENARLREEVHALRDQIARLRADLAAMKEAGDPTVRDPRRSDDARGIPTLDDVFRDRRDPYGARLLPPAEQGSESADPERDPVNEAGAPERNRFYTGRNVFRGFRDDQPLVPRGADWGLGHDQLVDLITRIVDTRSELRLAERELPLTTKLAESGHAPQGDLLRAEGRVEAAARRYQALQSIVAAEAEATKMELAAARGMLARAQDEVDMLGCKARIVRLEGRLKLLDAID